MSLSVLPTALLIPPVNCLLAACAGGIFARHRAGRVALAAGLAGLLVLSVPLVSEGLLSALGANLPGETSEAPAAIVILSGDESEGESDGKPAFGIGGLTLERERGGAALARRTGLPLLVSGGVIRPGAPALAAMMAQSMKADFGLNVRWTEQRSLDTWQNAAESAAMLRAAGIGSVYLVTHRWHMRRALIAFRHTGLHATPWPVGWEDAPPLDLDHLVPHARSWLTAYYALHEWIGCAWYAARG